jgi:hypothetical protein
VKGFHREAKGVAMLNAFGVELAEDSKIGLDTLVIWLALYSSRGA